MKPETDKGKLARRLVDIKTLLVIYALFDFVFTLIRVSHSQAKAAKADSIDFMYTPMQIAILGPGILLIASIGLWLSKPWSYLVAVAASLWLLCRGFLKWNAIARVAFPEIPMWSWPTLRTWWVYEGGEWDFPRLLLVLLVMIWATSLMIRQVAYKDSRNAGIR
jgi:hypothetical protein